MLVWSPAPRSPSGRVAASLPAGTLSPVSADSSICRRARGHDPPVGGDLVPGREQHHVADHQLLGGDLGLDPVAAHPGGGLHHRLERVHRALGLALLTQAGDRVDQAEQEQHDRGAPLLDQQRHHRRTDQDELHVAAVLAEQPSQPRRWLLLWKRVRAVPPQPLRRLRRRQPCIHIHTEPAGHVGRVERVPTLPGRDRTRAGIVCGRHQDFSLSASAKGSAAAPGGAWSSRVFLISWSVSWACLSILG